MNLNEILENRKQTIEARLGELREDVEAGKVDSATVDSVQEEIDKLAAELSAVKEEIDKLKEKAEGEEDAPAEGEKEVPAEENRSHTLEQEKRDALTRSIMSSLASESRTKAKEGQQRKAFANYLVGRIGDSEARSMGVDTSNGKVLVPETLSKEIITYAQEENLLRRYGTRVVTKGQEGYPVLTKKATANRLSTERTLDNPITPTDLDFSEVFLKPSETDALVLITKKLLHMTDMPIEQAIIEELKKAYVAKEAEYFFNSTDNPGSLYQKSVAFTTTETDIYNKLVRLKNTVPTAKLKNARWIMNRAALNIIETLKDANGQPLLRESFIEGAFGQKILGYPVDVSDYVDGSTPDVPRLYFGDFSSFHIQDVIGSMEVSKLLERYSDTNQVGFKIWHLNDGQLIYSPFEPSVFKLELGTDAPSA
ncbi:phage major capsid protein [Bacillus amyloliquefaciens]|uniref:phage major capsid protein n=1 Tax=Bacillus amyloliquefaciens TaxID=1390 RepID=UPI002DF814F7|nr:phage major capsid protein [Bacillus amyloliquefaciens]MEC5258488.1 phage major capsid protein [Bacillus amyloliquefaciens]